MGAYRPIEARKDVMMVTVSEFINKVGFKVNEGDVKKVNGTISDIKSTATKLLGAIGIGFSLSSMNTLVEEFDAVNDKINSAVSGLGDVKEAQKSILEAANEAKSSYSDMAGIVSNLVKAGSDMFPVQDAIYFSTNVTKLLKSAGRGDGEIAGIMEALNKSFQKGIVDSETLNQLLEKAPEGANLLAKSMGVAKTELLTMASDGRMTVNDLKDAFIGASDEIDAAFDQLNFGVSDALLNIRNKFGFWLKESDEMLGLTQAIGKTMVRAFDMGMNVLNRVRNSVVWLSEKLGGADRLLRLVALSAAGLFVAFNFPKITSGLSSVLGLLKMVKPHLLIVTAAVVLLALLVEDFYQFMKGNDSLIGTLLQRAGVDVDKFRSNVIKIWTNLKTAARGIFLGIKNVIVGMFKGAFEMVHGILEKFAPGLAKTLAGLVDKLANGNVNVDDWIKLGETIAKVVLGIGGAVTAFKTVTSVIKTVSGVVKTGKTVIEGVTGAFGKIQGVTKIASGGVGLLSKALGFLTSPTGLVIAGIVALIAIIVLLVKNWDKVKAAAKACWDFIVGVWSSVAGWFNENVIQPIANFFKGLWTSVTSTVGKIKDSVVKGFQSAINWIKSLPSQALKWGADIIGGIVDGIKGAVSKVTDAVKGVAENISSFLHFSVPDKGPLSDFDTSMPDMIRLMVKGIRAGKSSMNNALDDLTSNMSDRVKASVESAVGNLKVGFKALAYMGRPMANTVSSITGSNNVSRSVVQNVNINNRFEGDRAGQQKSAAAMNKAAKDSTSELARGLKYTR